MTVNQLTYLRDLETQRHNLEMEKITRQHNVAEEEIGRLQAYASQTAAAASYYQAQIAEKRYELDTLYYNKAAIMQKYQIDYTRAQTGYVVAQRKYTEARTAGQIVQNQSDVYTYTLDRTYAGQERAANLAKTQMETTTGYIKAGTGVANVFVSWVHAVTGGGVAGLAAGAF